MQWTSCLWHSFTNLPISKDFLIKCDKIHSLSKCFVQKTKKNRDCFGFFKKKVKSPWTITNKTPFILNMFCTLRFSNHQRNIRNSDFIFAANKRTYHFLAVIKIINVCYLSMLCNNVNRFPKYLSPIRTTLGKKDGSGSEKTNSI